MTSRSKTVFNFTVLVVISILWILLFDKYHIIPFILIIFSLHTFYRVWKTRNELLRIFDSAESVIGFQPDNEVSNKLGALKYTITDNFLNFEEETKSKEFKRIIKVDKSNNKLIHYKLSRNEIELSEIDYFSMMITRTLKTKRNIIQISYKYKGRLHEVLLHVCSPNLDFEKIKSYFSEFIGQLGFQTGIDIKVIEK